MTIGEKIQYYRKKLGVSQEELGQKLLVSRQTISLWENGQTIPTIDNLMRLKDIFGVSVDDILNNESDIEEKPIPATESYCFHYPKAELAEIYMHTRKSLLKRFVPFLLIWLAVLLFCIVTSAPETLIGFAVGGFIIGSVSHVKGFMAYKKTWIKNQDKIAESLYAYQVYEDHFILSISRNSETIRTSKVYFADVEQIQDIGTYLMLAFAGQSFILRKSELPPTSAFYHCVPNDPPNTILKKPSGKWRILSLVLFIGSLVSIYGALLVVRVASNINHLFIGNMWLFFLLTPIPIASTVFGFILKAKGYKYKKNVIAGIIMTVLLCIYGSFSFVFTDVYSPSDDLFPEIDQYTEMYTPEQI